MGPHTAHGALYNAPSRGCFKRGAHEHQSEQQTAFLSFSLFSGGFGAAAAVAPWQSMLNRRVYASASIR